MADDAAIDQAADSIRARFDVPRVPMLCDIADALNVARLRDGAAVDILVNNAGIERVTPALGGMGKFFDIDAEGSVGQSNSAYYDSRRIEPPA